ncbi:21725_t:CDS:2 [Dentiscutata erythropus]|uniref:21725_t:CDS:1 n=1 Tax=Dentiscutata erythropus TaxID=1348616 RepID=A0A9N9FAC7_9GLOM|nr:21725_t:CDS:2 [Dentiscutata erythropus]
MGSCDWERTPPETLEREGAEIVIVTYAIRDTAAFCWPAFYGALKEKEFMH